MRPILMLYSLPYAVKNEPLRSKDRISRARDSYAREKIKEEQRQSVGCVNYCEKNGITQTMYGWCVVFEPGIH